MTSATNLALTIPRPLRDAGSRERLLRRWLSVDPATFPERVDDKEPVRVALAPDRLSEILAALHESLLLARRTKPRVHFDVLAFDRDRAYIGATISPSAGHGHPEDVATLGRALADELRPDYGLVHTLTRKEVAEVTLQGRPDLYQGATEGSSDLMAGMDSQLRYGLTTLYWENYFGLPYVELFGHQRLAAVPAHEVIETDWGVIVRLTRDPPTDESWPRFRETREAAMQHLGADAFWPRASRVPESFSGRWQA